MPSWKQPIGKTDLMSCRPSNEGSLVLTSMIMFRAEAMISGVAPTDAPGTMDPSALIAVAVLNTVYLFICQSWELGGMVEWARKVSMYTFNDGPVKVLAVIILFALLDLVVESIGQV